MLIFGKNMPEIYVRKENQNSKENFGIVSMELPDGDFIYSRLSDEISLEDTINYFTNSKRPYLTLMEIERGKLNSVEFAEYEQSELCKFSIHVVCK